MINLNYSKTSDWVWLFIGIAVTILYLVFADPFYNMFYYGSDGFSDTMYDTNMYFVIAAVCSCVVWAVAILYYLLLDTVKLSKFWGWALGLIIAIALVVLLTVYIPDGKLMEDNLDYIGDLWSIGIINIIVSLVMYVIISLSLKGLSANCRTCPF